MARSGKASDLSAVSDSELTVRLRACDEAAFDELASRYSGLISAIARKYSASGFDRCDFHQIGLMGLLSAAQTYDTCSPASFRNYAAVCISRRFKSVLRKAGAKGVIPESFLVSLDGLELSDENSLNPETLYLAKESSRSFLGKLRTTLSPLEYTILMRHLSGLSYAAIASELSVTTKSVDNALQRIRRKLINICPD